LVTLLMSDASLSSALPNFPSQASEQASLSPLIVEGQNKLLVQLSKIILMRFKKNS
jgi:hypothetical protein